MSVYRYVRLLLLVLGVGALGGCSPAPKRWYAPGEVLQLTSLTEIMRVQEERSQALFRVRGYDSFSNAEYEAMFHLGLLLQASGARTAQRFGDQYGQGFVDHANTMVAQAKSLERVSKERNARLCRHLLMELHDVCADCHSDYR